MQSSRANRTPLKINSNSPSEYKNGQIYKDEDNRILQSQNEQNVIENDLDGKSQVMSDDKIAPKSKLQEMTNNQKIQALNSDKITPISSQSAEKEEVNGDKTLEVDKKGLSEEKKKQAEAAIGKKYQMSNKAKELEDSQKAKEQRNSDEQSPKEIEEEKRKKKIDQERGIVKTHEKNLNKDIRDSLSNEARHIDEIEGKKSEQANNPSNYNEGNKIDTAFNVHNDAEYEKLALEHLMKLKKVRLRNDPSQDEPIHIDDSTMREFFKDMELQTLQNIDKNKNERQKEKQEFAMSAIDYIANNVDEDSKHLKYDDLNGLNEAAKDLIKENLENFTEAFESVKNPIDGLSEARRKEIIDHIKSKISFIAKCNQGDALVRLGKILKEDALFSEYEKNIQKEIDGSKVPSLPSNLKADDTGVAKEKTGFSSKEIEKKATKSSLGRQ